MQRTQISLTAEDRRLLDAEARRTGRSLSALIRDAVTHTYAAAPDAEVDMRAIENASGAWAGREIDGASYVDELRSGSRILDSDRR